eukprot:2918980-Amphidinium_carterae.1
MLFAIVQVEVDRLAVRVGVFDPAYLVTCRRLGVVGKREATDHRWGAEFRQGTHSPHTSAGLPQY